MYRETNRASFMGKNNSSRLATTYGKLVAIEVTIKDVMGAQADPKWKHNLPIILTSFAANYSISSAKLNSLATQLGNQLSRIVFLKLSGVRASIPRDSYPYMRYLMHEWDGNHPHDTKESDIIEVDRIAISIINTLKNDYMVSV